MTNKRTSIKGKGADIFLDEEENQPTSIKEENNTITPEKKKAVTTANQIKVTYFINELTAENLEDIWLNLRRKFKNRKISKSKIVEIAVNSLIEDWEKNQETSSIETFLKNQC